MAAPSSPSSPVRTLTPAELHDEYVAARDAYEASRRKYAAALPAYMQAERAYDAKDAENTIALEELHAYEAMYREHTAISKTLIKLQTKYIACLKMAVAGMKDACGEAERELCAAASNLHLEPTPAEWRAARSAYLTSSEVAPLLGQRPRQSQ